MAYYPFAPETGAKYTLTSPDGVTATFNDPFDPNYVGMLAEVTGLDSADVRESADDLVEADGGQHGYFWLGRRPIVLNGRVFGHASVAQRAARLDRGRRASFALRGDSTLSWKPSTRRENFITNPRVVSATGWTATFSGGLTSTAFTQSAGGGRVQATQPTDTTSRTAALMTATGASGFPVIPGRSYTASAQVVHTDAPGTGSKVEMYFYKSDGTASSTPFISGTYSGATTNGTFTPTLTATAPSDAAFGALRIFSNTTVASDVIDVTWSAVLYTETLQGTTYFDGNTAGFYWQGVADASASGDFVEMYTPVRRQQPWRESGNWNKDFQCALVSQYSPLFSVQQKSVTAAINVGATMENRGSYAAYPVVRIAGGGLSNPIVTRTGGEVFTTAGQGLTIASGEILEVDFLNHTAKFVGGGGRSGQSGNRYINFATTQWPTLPAGNSVYTLTGTGTGSLTVFWRDTWA